MSNYYEMLHISPNASTAEIQVACDTLYNRWRGLVNHQDPGIVAQANSALRTVETIRATLMDPAKRAVYDASLNVGGLADPEALLRQAGPMTPPVSHSAPQPADSRAASQASNLWVCPKCHNDNPPNTRHCFKCGTELMRQCPECDEKLSLVASGFCSGCGYPYELAMQRAVTKKRVGEAEALVSEAESSVLKIGSSEGCMRRLFTRLCYLILCVAMPSSMLFLIGLPYSENSRDFKNFGLACMAMIVVPIVVLVAFAIIKRSDVQRAKGIIMARENELRTLRKTYSKLELKKNN